MHLLIGAFVGIAILLTVQNCQNGAAGGNTESAIRRSATPIPTQGTVTRVISPPTAPPQAVASAPTTTSWAAAPVAQANPTPANNSPANPAPQSSGPRCGAIVQTAKGLPWSGTLLVQPGCVAAVDAWSLAGADGGHVFILEPGSHQLAIQDGKIAPSTDDRCMAYRRALDEYRAGSGGRDPQDNRKPAGC